VGRIILLNGLGNLIVGCVHHNVGMCDLIAGSCDLYVSSIYLNGGSRSLYIMRKYLIFLMV
ncbi:MAG: hypothetical protein QG657_5196, partial [Acidobacteriota bacterium]|nr:hypothetical protein [Acidobacteriota bacterium]